MASIHVKFSASNLVIVLLMVVIVFMVMFDGCDNLEKDQLALRVRHLKEQLQEKEMLLARAGQREVGDKGGKHPPDRADDSETWGPHKLAILVPFRDRFEELMEFVPYMHKYLSRQRVRHHIYIINQMDHLRFNRASLINIGYIVSNKECDYMAMHDVDLLPRNNDLSYRYDVVKEGPHHMAAPELHPNYHYPKFVGGILLMKAEHFQLVNGLSNNFWGWGREDDELYMRMEEAQLKITRPVGITTGFETFYHLHNPARRKRDMTRVGNQKKESFKRDRKTGLDTVLYDIRSTQELDIEGAPCTVLHVELTCDTTVTPWCEIPKEAVRKPVQKPAPRR